MGDVLVRLVTLRSFSEAAAVVEVEGADRVVALGTVSVADVLADATVRSGAEATIRRALESGASALPALTAMELDVPVRPSKLICLGYNYRGHAPDGVDPATNDPEYPDVFVKTANAINAPGDPVVIPEVAEDVDYEGEIAIVVGRRAHRVSFEHALEHIGGYTILNDVSDRAWQRRQSQWTMGKCFDGFAPLGPWVVTADEIDDPQDLLVEVIRDGEVTVSQSTATTIFSAAFIVHYLSQTMTLEVGDVISTGTPQKLPHAQDAHRPLAPGEAVTVRVQGIGELTTTFTSHGGTA